MCVRIDTITSLVTSEGHFDTIMHTVSGDPWYFLHYVIQKYPGRENMFKRTRNIKMSSQKEHMKTRGKVSLFFQAAEFEMSCYNIT